MGIEPTWDFVEPHAGFEDQERQPGRLPPPRQISDMRTGSGMRPLNIHQLHNIARIKSHAH